MHNVALQPNQFLCNIGFVRDYCRFLSQTDWININVRYPSIYWGDTWMGNIDWDPSNGWTEWLE